MQSWQSPIRHDDGCKGETYELFEWPPERPNLQLICLGCRRRTSIEVIERCCGNCRKPLRGGRRAYCDEACKQQAYRQRKAN